MALEQPTEPFLFQPVETVPVGRSIGDVAHAAAETALQIMIPRRREGGQNPYRNTPSEWSVVLQTEQGFIKLERNHQLGPTISLIYPDAIHPLSDQLVGSIFGSEPGELRNTFKGLGNPPESRLKRTGHFRLPEADAQGNRYWLQYDLGRLIDMDQRPATEQMALLGGRLGALLLTAGQRPHNIGLHRGFNVPYEGKIAAKSTPEAVKLVSGRFKRLTIAVANLLGGAYQITAPMEEGRLVPPYGRRSTYSIAARWAINGYKVSHNQREPGEGVDLGHEVLMGTKNTRLGKDTIAAEAGLSAFYYTRGQKIWRFTRGVVLNRAATVSDLNSFAPNT